MLSDDDPRNVIDEKCPRCTKLIKGFPALSRTDNETYICSDCGTQEGMEDYFLDGCKPISKWPIKPNMGMSLNTKLDNIGTFFTSRVKDILNKEEDNNE